MLHETIHNPDRYMTDLRQILSKGRKKIGILLGAGVPTSIRVDENGNLDQSGKALICDIAGLTTYVIQKLNKSDSEVIDIIIQEMKKVPGREEGYSPNIEAILTKIRKLALAIGTQKINDLDGDGYRDLGRRICQKIGEHVAPKLPKENNAYNELVSWISGIHREKAVEIFTPNYDLLMEEAFERAKEPYFDGFTGAHCPFFDPVSISNDELPARWSRLWKIHGSLGWDVKDDVVIRTGSRDATTLIYPDHLKYDEITRLPYSALFERLRSFLTTPDSLLICSGFSFFDSHICAVFDEALAANSHTAIFAFQYKNLEDELNAVKLAKKRPNLSIYARDGAVISGVSGKWVPGEPPNDSWEEIRKTFWKKSDSSGIHEFILGDFAALARFFSLAQALNLKETLLSTSTHAGFTSQHPYVENESETTLYEGK
ncbi:MULTISPECIES: SIR2 family protein [Enterobacter cloacae complex]|uniref:SIR2 family protein n=1 Tax=Enterobacter cloacae complex TaxID=354276 RepID=UPI000D0BCF61|nr:MULTISPECIES: SIR2 family protein [Enterobacter cloacae complex]AVP02536.1 SIR2 family protein [Enterobacter cloacae complex sp. FDA-CDC-AR_0132]MBQ0225013.1 SIR2 family protein [Enterobacter ludwigii]MED5696165.1 SIR2 family protein [Enterobacter ludwigii]